MRKISNNYAFIDAQNLHLGIKKLGWKLDHQKFRIYLREKYAVEIAYIFLGFVSSNQELYNLLRKVGFEILFKATIPDSEGSVKGNVDADLVLKVVTEIDNYDKAVIVSSDGDFYSLVRYLNEKNKLELVLSPDAKNCSGLIKDIAKGK